MAVYEINIDYLLNVDSRADNIITTITITEIITIITTTLETGTMVATIMGTQWQRQSLSFNEPRHPSVGQRGQPWQWWHISRSRNLRWTQVSAYTTCTTWATMMHRHSPQPRFWGCGEVFLCLSKTDVAIGCHLVNLALEEISVEFHSTIFKLGRMSKALSALS